MSFLLSPRLSPGLNSLRKIFAHVRPHGGRALSFRDAVRQPR